MESSVVGDAATSGRSIRQPESAAEAKEAVVKRFVKYTFFKVAREWRSLSTEDRAAARDEFLSAIDSQATGTRLSFFSLVGIRGDTDFMVFADSESIETFQTLVSSLLATSLGKYLEIPYSYLAMTRESPYLGSHRHEGQEGSAGSSLHSRSKYLFVYPFVKKRKWYSLPVIERRRIMADHFRIGHGYPGIKIHTAYSFGLDDQEFMLGFEGDDPSEFLALVEELRSSEASKYTQLETPIFTCLRVTPERMLELIG